MSSGPLTYPVGVTIGALAVCTAWAPFATSSQAAVLAAVALVILGYTAFQLSLARGLLRTGLPVPATAAVKRVRQEHRLLSRSWLEFTAVATSPNSPQSSPAPLAAKTPGSTDTYWLPVYFDPALLAFTLGEADLADRLIRIADLRVYPSGRARTTEPPGRLIDNPSRVDPESPALAATSTRISRRLLLDAQSAVAAPFAALLWVYLDGGGLPAFTGACCVAFAAAIWLSAIRGSDPS
ncbi:hypothetical protein [Nocardia sp. XZ_19_385]|uniref:hypothetical protein n=1 Tax=Nocardia sp. XZ_19_385 TaxID=2769488 RepID=UPI00189007AE|nr:hypothetical protein [Nocardia sp. XZ_19_385]